MAGHAVDVPEGQGNGPQEVALKSDKAAAKLVPPGESAGEPIIGAASRHALDREVHGLLCERLARLPRRRPSWWGRFLRCFKA